MATDSGFVLTNHKGGGGKSTSTTNIALGLAGVLRNAGTPNARVLLINTDGQAHATWVTTGRTNYGTDGSLYAVLTAERPHAAHTPANGIVPRTWGH